MNNKRNPKARRKGNNNWKSSKDNFKTSDSKIAEEKYNDPSWYLASGQLAKDVGSFSFNNSLGAPTTINVNPGGTATLASFDYRAPGIMTIMTAPSFGVSTGGHSALNLAAKNFYSWIRHANSGHSNYDSPDIMLYLGAMDSLYAIVAYFMRAYGVARVYSQVNRYIGDALLYGMGLDPDDVRSNIAQLRGYINMFITKLSAFATPDTMTLFKRHFWMFSGVYKDEPVTKSQMYMYVPAVLWMYNETSGGTGFLQAVPWVTDASGSALSQVGNAGNTLGSLMFKADSMLAAIVDSEDINIMSGDILKAYPNAIWKLSLVPEDYSVVPVYSEEVLDQIHNSSFAGNLPVATTSLSTVPTLDLTRLNVYQDPNIGSGALLFMPQFVNVWGLDYDRILDMHYESPAPEEVLVATRNMMVGHSSSTTAASNNVAVTDLDTCGSDICLWAEILTLTSPGQVPTISRCFADATFAGTGWAVLSKLSQFNKYPWYYRHNTGLLGAATGVYGEIDNYTVLSKDDVAKLHDTAILSLLGVPFLGTAAK